MLPEEEKDLREAMHDARDKSGVSEYIVSGRDIGPISEDLMDARYTALYGMRNNDSQAYLDMCSHVQSYSDIRDWVEGVVDGFHKGMQFDGKVDKQKNVDRAVNMFLEPVAQVAKKQDRPVAQVAKKQDKHLQPNNTFNPLLAMQMGYRNR